jgi:hypothetical protein
MATTSVPQLAREAVVVIGLMVAALLLFALATGGFGILLCALAPGRCLLVLLVLAFAVRAAIRDRATHAHALSSARP